MIDPTDVTKFDRTDAELEEFWLFCICVAGKTAVQMAEKLDTFLNASRLYKSSSPFQVIRELIADDDLEDMLKLTKMGQYTKLVKAFTQSLALNLRTATVADFEAIDGVGAKTARYFLLHTRANQRIACLDTHVVRHMRDLGLTEQKGTPPSGPKYKALEEQFLALADAAKMSPADFDLMIWNKYARKV